MKTVKLTFNFDFPVFRQTPNFSGVWGDYKFVIDDNLKECDYWIVYTEYGLKEEQCHCSRNNIIFIPGESYETSLKYPKDFLRQFGRIITVQKEISGKNVIHWQNANPWFIEKTYDEIINLKVPEKRSLISVVTSNKAFTPGHRQRLDFCMQLKKHFGDKLDLFGRGICDFEKKWDVTAPYRYHIAIENNYCDDWVTEKFFDPILTYTYPIYFGCPNLNTYMPDSSFTRINIDNFDESVAIIERVINDDELYKGFLSGADTYRNLYLNTHQFFPMVTKFLNEMPSDLPKARQKVRPLVQKNSVLKRVYKKLMDRK